MISLTTLAILQMPQIWTYMYTTMAESPDLDTTQNDFKAPMAGFGYGLPLSRLVSWIDTQPLIWYRG